MLVIFYEPIWECCLHFMGQVVKGEWDKVQGVSAAIPLLLAVRTGWNGGLMYIERHRVCWKGKNASNLLLPQNLPASFCQACMPGLNLRPETKSPLSRKHAFHFFVFNAALLLRESWFGCLWGVKLNAYAELFLRENCMQF